MLENVVKKLFPIRDENNQPCTFPTFGSQVFSDDEEGRALWQDGNGFYADMAKNAENSKKLGGKPASAYQLSENAYQRVLLYENDTPGSAFASQTLSVNLSNWNKIAIEWSHYLEESSIMCEYRVGLKGFAFVMESGSNSYIMARNIEVATTGIHFGDAYDRDSSKTSMSLENRRMIPLRIYGLPGVS